MEALYVSVGSKRKRNIASTAGPESYTIVRQVKGRESLDYGILNGSGPSALVENDQPDRVVISHCPALKRMLICLRTGTGGRREHRSWSGRIVLAG